MFLHGGIHLLKLLLTLGLPHVHLVMAIPCGGLNEILSHFRISGE